MTPGNESKIELNWGARIPLRDGVELNATIYRPAGAVVVPAVVVITPYSADTFHDRAIYFSRRGYAFVLVDSRGRGNSGGQFTPFFGDGPDGYDVVEWLAAQPWCDGAVGMWGGSYGGYNQWMTLKEAPPHLRTIVPAAAAHTAVDTPFRNNIAYPYIAQWLALTSGVIANKGLFSDSAFWIAKFQELYLNHLPFAELDRLVGNPSTHFQAWLANPTPGPFWAGTALAPENYAAIDLPILTITGHYDDNQLGAMHYYRSHMGHGSPAARAQHHLIIGPWDHAGTRTPVRRVGGWEFGAAAEIDLNDLHKAWYDWTLKDGPRPEFLRDRVAYYVTGAETWRYAESLEAMSGAVSPFYLDSTAGQANDVFHSGTLASASPTAAGPDSYTYDPLDLRPAELEAEPVAHYLTDQSYDLNLYDNGLVYHSAPFETETEISGVVRLVVWLAMDVPDTDLHATLTEVMRNGRCLLLTQDYLRARYRESLAEARLVTPGQVACYEFDGFTLFSRRIAQGSRLRLLIHSPNSIYVQKNYNSGGDVARETAEDARVAHVSLFHDPEHPSRLELPLVALNAARKEKSL